MKTRSAFRSAFGFALCSIGLLLALRGSGLFAAARGAAGAAGEFRHSVWSVVSQRCLAGPARSSGALAPYTTERDEAAEAREANLNPQLPLPLHVDVPDPVIDHGVLGLLVPERHARHHPQL